jgi:hypothetical protein
LASGLFTTTQQIGMAIGVAVLSTLAASRTEVLLPIGEGDTAALTGGYHLAFGTAGTLLVAAFTVALIVLWQRITDTADTLSRRPSDLTR